MERLGDKSYDAEEIQDWSKSISDDIKNKLKGNLKITWAIQMQTMLCKNKNYKYFKGERNISCKYDFELSN